MTPNEAREAIEERFVAQWAARTLFTFENEKFKEAGADTPWVRLSVRHFGGGQETLGPKGQRKYQRIGAIIAQVFTPLVKGMKAGATYAQDIRGIFEGERFSDVYAWNGRVLEIGPDGKHYQTNIEIDITYEEKK